MQSFGAFAQSNELPEKFISGDLRYECVWGCNFKFDYARNSINEIYRNKDWIGLVNKMDEFGLNSRTTYFALFRAAEELGHYEAARVYLKLAKANGLEMGCFAINKLDMCAEMSRINSITVRETTLADKTISEDILKVSENSYSSQQTNLISADTKQKEKIELIQIKADVSNQVVNLGVSNNSLRRVEQPLFEKSTVAQLNVQASNVPSQILIDACKALQDLQKKSDCLEMILKMGQNLVQPQNQIQAKQTLSELENLRLAISSIVVGITSGSRWDVIDEKINSALVLKEGISSLTYEVSDERYKNELLMILNMCEDYKYISRYRNYDPARQTSFRGESTREYKIGIKYGIKPNEINYTIAAREHFSYGIVLSAIEKKMSKDYEVSYYKWKNRYLENLSWEEKTNRIVKNFMLLVNSNPYSDGIDLFNSRLYNFEAELVMRCESDKNRCNSDEQVKKKEGQDILISVFNDVFIIYKGSNHWLNSNRPRFVEFANKYRYPISYTTFLGVPMPKLDKEKEGEKLINFILNSIKEKTKSVAENY